MSHVAFQLNMEFQQHQTILNHKQVYNMVWVHFQMFFKVLSLFSKSSHWTHGAQLCITKWIQQNCL